MTQKGADFRRSELHLIDLRKSAVHLRNLRLLLFV